jgi:hypothetical protein
MSLATKVKLYCSANGISNVDFRKDVKIVDLSDGTGAKIIEWNIDSLAQPTDDQLNSYNSSATTEENNNKVIDNRLNEYPSLGDIVDAIFKKEAGDATEFNSLAAKRQSIKNANPKE